jgi:RNA polymerase sigma-70 factor (ECF subfamily)
MPEVSTELARWLAAHILPLEPQLRGWLKRVTPPGLEVDDLIQEAYARLAGLATVESITQPKAYLYQIVKRLIADHIRRASVVSIDAAAELAEMSVLEDEMTPERIISARQELERVYEAIVALPNLCRTVFVMRKFDDQPQKAIASELHVSENIVEKRMMRALQMLLENLKQARGEPGSPQGEEIKRRKRRDA